MPSKSMNNPANNKVVTPAVRQPPPRPSASPATKAQQSSDEPHPKIDPATLKRPQGKRPEPPPEPPPVSAGPVDKVIELAFNPTREKIREVTIIDRFQAKLLPQLDLISQQWQYVLEVATYRRDSLKYKEIFKKDIPVPPSPIEEFVYRIAQWQKSVAGKNLERATDIALAETETRAEDEEGTGGDAWKE